MEARRVGSKRTGATSATKRASSSAGPGTTRPTAASRSASRGGFTCTSGVASRGTGLSSAERRRQARRRHDEQRRRARRAGRGNFLPGAGRADSRAQGSRTR
eukprot:3432089-Heterocapsa_arctica.AAC.1